MQGGSVETTLEAIANPPKPSQHQEQWDKIADQSPALLTAGGRELFYGVVTKALRGDEQTISELQNSPELVAEIESYFENVFKCAEQSSMSKRRVSSSS